VKCASVQLSLGAYVLGALGRRESRQIHEHVAACGACREELMELARLRPLLDQLSLDELGAELDLAGEVGFSPVVQPHPRVLRRLLRRAALERKARKPGRPANRSGFRLGLVACLLLVAVVTGGIVTVVAAWPGGQVGPAQRADPSAVTVTDAATNVVVNATLIARPAGTDITVSLTGGTPGEWCWLVAVGQDGRTEQFASWQVTSGGDATVTDHTAIDRSDLISLRIVRDDQRLLANLPTG
jgi:anti-sigma factor RsiW